MTGEPATALAGEINQVLARLNSLLSSDGGNLSLVEAKGDSITVRFTTGGEGACERCAIDGDAMAMLVREAVANHLPAIRNVQLINA